MFRCILLTVCVLLFSISSLEQIKPADPRVKTSATSTLRASRVTEQIKIDGILNESAWVNADVISNFSQQEPTRASQRPREQRSRSCSMTSIYTLAFALSTQKRQR